jgi:hypothetical protein
MAAEKSPIEPMSRIAAPAEAPRGDGTIPADPTLQVPLPLTSDSRFRYRLDDSHTPRSYPQPCRPAEAQITYVFNYLKPIKARTLGFFAIRKLFCVFRIVFCSSQDRGTTLHRRFANSSKWGN